MSDDILLWRAGALGDSLLLLPALAALRAAHPTQRIVVAGTPAALAPALWPSLADEIVDATSARLAPLVSGQPCVSGALPAGIGTAVIWSARHVEIARGLALTGIARLIGAPILPAPLTHMVDHYLRILAPLGVAPVAFKLTVPAVAMVTSRQVWGDARYRASRSRRDLPAMTSWSEGRSMDEVSGDQQDPVVILHPGAGSRAKRWPLAGYLDLARLLRAEGIAILWTLGPADEDMRSGLDAAGEGDCVLPALNLAILAAVLTRASVVVSADCGVAHLTALLGVRGVALFGPTNHHVWAPPGTRTTTTVLALDLPCAPCGDVMHRCPSRLCMRALPVRAVYHAVRASLGQPEGLDSLPVPAPPASSRPAAVIVQVPWRRVPLAPASSMPHGE